MPCTSTVVGSRVTNRANKKVQSVDRDQTKNKAQNGTGGTLLGMARSEKVEIKWVVMSEGGWHISVRLLRYS